MGNILLLQLGLLNSALPEPSTKTRSPISLAILIPTSALSEPHTKGRPPASSQGFPEIKSLPFL